MDLLTCFTKKMNCVFISQIGDTAAIPIYFDFLCVSNWEEREREGERDGCKVDKNVFKHINAFPLALDQCLISERSQWHILIIIIMVAHITNVSGVRQVDYRVTWISLQCHQLHDHIESYSGCNHFYMIFLHLFLKSTDIAKWPP